MAAWGWGPWSTGGSWRKPKPGDTASDAPTWSVSTKEVITLAIPPERPRRDCPVKLTNDGGRSYVYTGEMTDEQRIEAYARFASRIQHPLDLGIMHARSIEKGAPGLAKVLLTEMHLRRELP